MTRRTIDRNLHEHVVAEGMNPTLDIKVTRKCTDGRSITMRTDTRVTGKRCRGTTCRKDTYSETDILVTMTRTVGGEEEEEEG